MGIATYIRFTYIIPTGLNWPFQIQSSTVPGGEECMIFILLAKYSKYLLSYGSSDDF